jgi:hypothetical protein
VSLELALARIEARAEAVTVSTPYRAAYQVGLDMAAEIVREEIAHRAPVPPTHTTTTEDQ